MTDEAAPEAEVPAGDYGQSGETMEGSISGAHPEARAAFIEGTGARSARVIGGAGVAVDPPGEIRNRRGEGRRVNLRRNADGNYSVWLGDRMIQSFCAEWEDITRFQLPEGIQQQCRIHVQVMGEAREWDRGEQTAGVAGAVAEDDLDPSLQNIAHPRLDRNELVRMFNALPAQQQDIIARQISTNHQDLLRSRLEEQHRIQHEVRRLGYETAPSNHPATVGMIELLSERINHLESALALVRSP